MGDDHVAATRLHERSSDPNGVEVLRWLVAELVANGVPATQPAISGLSGEEGEEIILDVEISGERWCLTRRLVEPAEGSQPLLSPREQEIARMVAKGYANKSIASILDISSWTVSSHLRRIYAKLGVSSRAAMVARLLATDRTRGQPADRKTAPPSRLPASLLDGRRY
jgi:DNA-binding CsgD family transcriptional regulator